MIFSKKTTSKTIVSLLFIGLAFFCHGQNSTLDYIPADAPFVLSINLGNLGERVNLNDLKQYDFYKEILKEMDAAELEDSEKKYMHAFLDSPVDLGFDMLRPFYFFVKEEGDTTFYTMVMEMGNRAKYEAGIMNLFPEKYTENLTEKAGYSMWQDHTETYVWNDEIILNIWSEYTPSFDDWNFEEPMIDTFVYDEDIEFEVPPAFEENLSDTIPEVFEIDTTIMDEGINFWGVNTRPAAAHWADLLMNRQVGKPLSTNAKYQSAKGQNADLHFWMDYDYFLSEYKENMSIGGMSDDKTEPYKRMATDFVYEIYGGSYLSWGLSFEEGKMALRTQQFFNQKVGNFHQKIKKVKFNKKFFRYVEGGSDMFGYAYFNVNIKNAIEEGRSVMHNFLRSNPDGGLAASDAMKILGIFIDEEAIGNLFRGDLMVSFSGMQTVEVTEKTYDFDDDFNYVEKDTTIKKEIPNLTALATFGNRKDIQKFIDLGIHSEVLKRDGDFFRMEEPTSGLTFYLTLEKNMLILSNNREKLANSLRTKPQKDRRLSKKHRKLLCKNASVVYWDVPNTKRQTAKNNGETNFGPMYYVDAFGKQFENLMWRSSKSVDNAVNGVFEVNFKNKNTNALEQFFIFINDIYVEFQGGAKI